MIEIAGCPGRLLVAAIVLFQTTLVTAISAAPPARRAAQATASADTTPTGRTFVPLIDTTTLSPEQLADVRDAAAQFLSRIAGNSSRAAIVMLGDRIRIVTDFA